MSAISNTITPDHILFISKAHLHILNKLYSKPNSSENNIVL